MFLGQIVLEQSGRCPCSLGTWLGGLGGSISFVVSRKPSPQLSSCVTPVPRVTPCPSLLQIIKDGEQHEDLNEVAKLFNIHED